MSRVLLSNNIEISYNYELNEGSNETLVFMNGTFSSMKDWEEVKDALKQRRPYNFLTFDMRNQGESSQVREEFSYGDFVEDTTLLFEYLQLNQFTIITYSSASTMAIDYMLTHPGKVNRLVLGAPVINPYGKFKSQLISQASLKMFDLGDLKDIITLSFPLMYSNLFVEQSKDFFNVIQEQFLQSIDKSLLRPYMKAWDENDMTISKLKSVLENVTTFYIHGDEDIFNPVIFTEKLENEIGTLNVHILPGKGHDFLAEDKVGYISLLQDILE